MLFLCIHLCLSVLKCGAAWAHLSWLHFAPFPKFLTLTAVYDSLIKHESHASRSKGVDWIKSDGRSDTFSSPAWPAVALKATTIAVISFADKRGVRRNTIERATLLEILCLMKCHIKAICLCKHTHKHTRLLVYTWTGVVLALMDRGWRGCCNRVSLECLYSQLKGQTQTCLQPALSTTVLVSVIQWCPDTDLIMWTSAYTCVSRVRAFFFLERSCDMSMWARIAAAINVFSTSF